MKIKPYDIECYLSGDMTDEDFISNLFESTCKDKELNDYFELSKDLDNVLSKTKEIKLRQLIRITIEKNRISIISKHSLRILTDRKVLTIAAIFIVLLLSVVFSLTNYHSSNNIFLFERYYTTFSGITNTRSLDTLGIESFDQAKFLFHEGDYFRAAEKFKSLLDFESDNNIYRLYLSSSLLETGDIEGAVLHLEILESTGDILYSSTARWYLALAYIRMKSNHLAIPLLKKIVKEGGAHATEAHLLLKKIK